MEDNDVDLEFKLEQFLADVHKFSKRYERNEKERNEDSQTSNQNKSKIGLFENSTLSNPIVKGEHKTKARLIGNLEPLAGRRDKEHQITSEEESSEHAIRLIERKLSSKNKKITTSEADSKKKVSEADLKFEKKFLNEIDNLIKFSEKRAQECMTKLKDKANNIPKDSRDDALLKVHNKLMKTLHERSLKKALQDKDGLLQQFKLVCQEYMKSQKPNMIDKYVQTENYYFEMSSNQVFHKPENSLYFDLMEKRIEEPFSFNPGHQTVSKNSSYRKNENSIETPQVFKTKCPPATSQDDGKPYIPIILSPLSPGRKYASISPGMSNFNHYRKESKSNFSAIPSLQKNEVHNNFLLSTNGHHVHFKHSSPPLQNPYEFSYVTAKEKELFCDREFRLSTLEENKIHCNSFIPTVSHKRLSDSFNNFTETKNMMGMTSAHNKNFSSSKKIKLMFSPHKL